MIARADESDLVRLDLNNAVFQRQLFALEKAQQLGVLATLWKLSDLRWPQVYQDRGLKWELIHSRIGPGGQRLSSLRISQGFGPWRTAMMGAGCACCPCILITIRRTGSPNHNPAFGQVFRFWLKDRRRGCRRHR